MTRQQRIFPRHRKQTSRYPEHGGTASRERQGGGQVNPFLGQEKLASCQGAPSLNILGAVPLLYSLVVKHLESKS
jgi:hypothetical protein